jgi:hypothetical protein
MGAIANASAGTTDPDSILAAFEEVILLIRSRQHKEAKKRFPLEYYLVEKYYANNPDDFFLQMGYRLNVGGQPAD